MPSICTRDWPNWMRAMSWIGGCSIQPDRVTTCRTSSAAPQLGQDGPSGGCGMRQ
ncbi:hypothetical protein [Dactylosporangium darangshiense]|uniref:hypothetical protein n=1 Tax=Dactylosporangium darangshiense TaxID=579108 RepID=UPI0036384293